MNFINDPLMNGPRSFADMLTPTFAQPNMVCGCGCGCGRAWNMSVLTYNTSCQIIRERNCFAFMFTNIGNTIARVNGIIIFPSATPATALGDSRSISGHLLDFYKGNLQLSFQTPLNNAPLVEIIQLFYVPGETKIEQP